MTAAPLWTVRTKTDTVEPVTLDDIGGAWSATDTAAYRVLLRALAVGAFLAPGVLLRASVEGPVLFLFVGGTDAPAYAYVCAPDDSPASAAAWRTVRETMPALPGDPPPCWLIGYPTGEPWPHSADMLNAALHVVWRLAFVWRELTATAGETADE